jgi:hypothetical protein
MNQNEKIYRRIITQLDREQLDFLDKMEKDAFFSTGKKFSKSQILAALVDLLRELNISGIGIHAPEELKKKMVETIIHEKVA